MVFLGSRCMKLPLKTKLRAGQTRMGLWVRILGHQFLMLAICLTNNSVLSVFLVVCGDLMGSSGVAGV